MMTVNLMAMQFIGCVVSTMLWYDMHLKSLCMISAEDFSQTYRLRVACIVILPFCSLKNPGAKAAVGQVNSISMT